MPQAGKHGHQSAKAMTQDDLRENRQGEHRNFIHNARVGAIACCIVKAFLV